VGSGAQKKTRAGTFGVPLTSRRKRNRSRAHPASFGCSAGLLKACAVPKLWDAPGCKFLLDAPGGWLGSFLISSSDRRVLDELDPGSTQSARDRQPIHNRPAAHFPGPQAFSLQPYPRPVIFIESIHGNTRKRFANSRPARLALQLEARLTPTTISNNVSRQTRQPDVRYLQSFVGARHAVPLPGARQPFDFSVRRSGSRQTFQETSSTQWQKN